MHAASYFARLMGGRRAGLQRLACPVEVEADASLRTRAEPHRAQLAGVRVHVMQRDAQLDCELSRVDERERSRGLASDLRELSSRGFGDGLNVLARQPPTGLARRREPVPIRIRMGCARSAGLVPGGDLLPHCGSWFRYCARRASPRLDRGRVGESATLKAPCGLLARCSPTAKQPADDARRRPFAPIEPLDGLAAAPPRVCA